MPKLIVRQRPEAIEQQARDYVKSYILLPSGLLGLVSMIGGVGGLGYQLVASDSYTWVTFYASTALILWGVVIGVAQTRYHRFLLQQFPEVWAARMRSATAKKGRRSKTEGEPPHIDHPGRQWAPVVYVLGTGMTLGASWAAVMFGQVDGVPAVLLPWAGFFWARLFFWRGHIDPQS